MIVQMTSGQLDARLADIDALGGDWDALVTRMARPSPFMLSAWLREWRHHQGDGAAARVLVAMDQGSLRGGLPVEVHHGRTARMLRLMGDPAVRYGDAVVSNGDLAATRALLDAGLARTDYDFVAFSDVSAGSALESELLERGAHIVKQVPCPVMDLDEPLDAVLRRKMSAKQRSTLRRKRKKLSANRRVELTVATAPRDVSDCLEDCFAVHRKGWGHRADTSLFGTEAGRDFYRAVTPRLALGRHVVITLLRVNQEAVAFDYCFRVGEAMYLHRLAFDPAWGACSPGFLTTLDTIEHGFTTGVRRFEFGAGAASYKLALADRDEPLRTLVGLPRTWVGRAAQRRVRAVSGLREQARTNQAARRLRAHAERTEITRLFRRSPS